MMMRFLVWAGLQPRYKLSDDYRRFKMGRATEAEERFMPLPGEDWQRPVV